jgi:hypothetical protein
MKLNLTVIAKSDKHTGYCVAAMNEQGKMIRLVRDAEGHALTEEQYNFEKLYNITVSAQHAPLKHQSENYVLTELLETHKSGKTIKDLNVRLQNPPFVFQNTEPCLTEKDMRNQKYSFLFVQVDDLHIYQNDEVKYKADFSYRGRDYESFSITDPGFKNKERTIKRTAILVSLPDAPYKRYGNELYYKFIAAVYPLDHTEKSYLDCYKI